MADSPITSQVGQDQFLKLMVAQLKSQDPLEPIKDQEFLGQLAQFSTLSGIEKLNASFGDMLSLQQITQGANLMGQQIIYRNSDNQTAQGTVQGFAVNEGRIELQVGNDAVTLDNVIGMFTTAA
ncbi:MAG: flagellar hook capping protein [Planctomycetaceae bacterium]|nr:flagellar hook capping protein [Planctomycetaceae bacterium]